jgi:hypothetical protein
MKSINNSLAILLVFVFLGACKKETIAPTTSTPVAVISSFQGGFFSYKIGERQFDLNQIQEKSETNPNQGSTCLGGGGNPFTSCTNKDASSFANYDTQGKVIMIRQDDAQIPAFRLELSGLLKLETTALPYTLENAKLTMIDAKNALLIGDGQTTTVAKTYLGENEAIQVTITSWKDEVAEGTFSGTVKSTDGYQKEVKNGLFKMRLFK